MPLSTINSNSFSSTANTNIDNGTLFIDAVNGRVGAGTTAPTFALNVKAPSSEYRTALFETASTNGPAVQIKGSKTYELRSTNSGASEGGGLFFIYDKDNESSRLTIDSIGQLYTHAGTYLVGDSYNCYHAKMTTTVNISTSFQDTGVVWSGVYIPTNTRKVLLWYNASIRNNGLNQCHTAFRVRVVNNATSATTYVGNGSWGFGINMPIDSGKNHFQINQHINLLDYADQGNQASFSAGSTYTIYLQVTDSSASGGNLKLGGDLTFQSYTPVQGTIWII